MTKNLNETIGNIIDEKDPNHKLLLLLTDLIDNKMSTIDENINDIKKVLNNLEEKMRAHDSSCPLNAPHKIKVLEDKLNVRISELEIKLDNRITKVEEDIDIIRFFKKYKTISILVLIGLATVMIIYGVPALVTYLTGLI